jgi:hypothetical protein
MILERQKIYTFNKIWVEFFLYKNYNKILSYLKKL